MTEQRMEYLESLSEEWGVGIKDVIEIANLLGEEEDYDGLISHLRDFYEWGSHNG